MTNDVASLIYLLGALVLFGSSALAARARAKEVGAKGPGVLVSLLIWGGILCLVVVLYRASQFWGGVGSVFN